MSKPVALIDVDGVLADFTSAYVQVIAELFGAHRAPERPVDCWDIHVWAGLTPEEKRAVEERITSTRGWCRGLLPLPGAAESMARLREETDCIVVTSAWKGPYWHEERLEWIAEHAGVNHKDVIFTHRKDRIEGNLLLDDRLDNVVDWSLAQARRSRAPFLGVLMHQTHNAALEEPRYVTRAFSWDTVFHAVTSLRAGW